MFRNQSVLMDYQVFLINSNVKDIGTSPRVTTEHHSGDLNHPPKVPYAGQNSVNSYYRRPSNLDAIHQLPQQRSFHRSAGELRPETMRTSTSENIAQLMDKITIQENPTQE
jgi:hypothetical protein